MIIQEPFNKNKNKNTKKHKIKQKYAKTHTKKENYTENNAVDTFALHLVTDTNFKVWSLPRISSLHRMST